MDKFIDNCKGCKVPERMEYTNPFDYEGYFSCSDCACYRCEFLHKCNGQCAEIGYSNSEGVTYD